VGWCCGRGACLLIPSGPGEKSHLFTIVLGPKQLDGYGGSDQVVMVSVTTVKPDFPFDPACVIQAGEHPFIDRESYVYYREPRIETVAHVKKMVETLGWQPREECSPELFKKIIKGLRESKRLPRYVRTFLD